MNVVGVRLNAKTFFESLCFFKFPEKKKEKFRFEICEKCFF